MAFVVIKGKNLTCNVPHGLNVNLQPVKEGNGQCGESWCVAQKAQHQNGSGNCTYLCELVHIARAVFLNYPKNLEVCEVSFV